MNPGHPFRIAMKELSANMGFFFYLKREKIILEIIWNQWRERLRNDPITRRDVMIQMINDLADKEMNPK